MKCYLLVFVRDKPPANIDPEGDQATLWGRPAMLQEMKGTCASDSNANITFIVRKYCEVLESLLPGECIGRNGVYQRFHARQF